MEKEFIIKGEIVNCRSTYDSDTDSNGVDVYMNDDTFIGELHNISIPIIEDCETKTEYYTLLNVFEKELENLF